MPIKLPPLRPASWYLNASIMINNAVTNFHLVVLLPQPYDQKLAITKLEKNI